MNDRLLHLLKILTVSREEKSLHSIQMSIKQVRISKLEKLLTTIIKLQRTFFHRSLRKGLSR